MWLAFLLTENGCWAVGESFDEKSRKGGIAFSVSTEYLISGRVKSEYTFEKTLDWILLGGR